MRIISGLFDHMVLQRNRRNVCHARITGTVDNNRVLEVAVSQWGKRVKLMRAPVRRRQFAFPLTGLRPGGPYTVELTVSGTRERLTVRDVLVGDVWICAGQSNMQGAGVLSEDIKPHPMVRAFYMSDEWRVAKDPIHNLWEAIDGVHADLGAGPNWVHLAPFLRKNGKPCPPPKLPYWGVGPGVAFGQEMLRRTGVPQGLLACAHGGTVIAQWDPALKTLGGKSLYGAMIRRIQKNGGTVAGMIWSQCESDANPECAPHYTERTKQFAAALRRDCGNPRLPIALVQASRFASFRRDSENWLGIQEQQRRLATSIRHLAVVPSVDAEFMDDVHLTASSCHRLGSRLAQAMHVLRGGKGKLPISLRSIESSVGVFGAYAKITVRFDNVVGRLRANGRALGFSLKGEELCMPFYRTELRGDAVELHTMIPPGELSDKGLCYGQPIDPPCNITDEADRSLPVFGPLPVMPPRALTPFVQTLRLSKWLPGAGDLSKLDRPTDLAALELETRTFPDTFLDLHNDTELLKPQDLFVYYACRIECDEPMKLAACVGYDGPVKVWVDGKQIFHDPYGVNPAWTDKAAANFRASAGPHEVLVALGLNHCKAWGICLRFERLDVRRQSLLRAPLPRVL